MNGLLPSPFFSPESVFDHLADEININFVIFKRIFSLPILLWIYKNHETIQLNLTPLPGWKGLVTIGEAGNVHGSYLFIFHMHLSSGEQNLKQTLKCHVISPVALQHSACLQALTYCWVQNESWINLRNVPCKGVENILALAWRWSF